jgi:hypothetical protein
MNWIDINESERPYDGQKVLVKIGALDWTVAMYHRDSDTFADIDYDQQFWYELDDVTAWATVEL